MSDRVEVKIVGDDSGAQGAMRRAAQAVAEATNLMRSKLNEVQASSRTAFNSMGREARDAGDDVIETTGRMGSAFDRLKAHFQAFTTGFAKGWRDMGAEMRQARGELDRMQSGGGKSGGGFGAMEIFKGGVMLEGARKILEVGAAVVETSAEFERLRSVLLTLEGTQSAANGRFEQLKKFGQETPYELSEVVTAFSKLKAQGLDPSNAALKAYGNTAAAMGKSLDQMVEAVADAAMGEFERLKEFGIKASQQGDKVTFTFKGQATTVANSAAEIQAYLQNIGNTDFAGAMERQMDTLGGKFSNLKDVAAGFANEIGEGGLSSALKDSMDAMTGASGTSGELARNIGEILGQAVRGVTEIVKTFISVVQDNFQFMKQLVADVFGKAAGDALTWGNILRYVAQLVSAFADVVQWAFTIVATLARELTNLFVTLGEVIYRALTFDFSGMVAAVQNGMNRAASAFQMGWNRMVDINAKGQARINGINARGNMDSASTGYAAGLLSELNPGKATAGASAPRGGAGGGRRRGAGNSAANKAAAEEARAERELEQDTLDVIRNIQQAEQGASRSAIALSRMTLQDKLADIAELRQAGAISAQQEISMQADVNRAIRALDVEQEQADYEAARKALVSQRNLYGQQQAEYKKHQRAIEALDAQHRQRVKELEKKDEVAERETERRRLQIKRQAFQQVTQIFSDNIAKMLTLQQGFGATLRNIWGGLVQIFEQIVARMVQRWIMGLVAKTAAEKTARGVSVLGSAKEAAAGAWASTVKIPFVGPFLAPIAAATAFAGVMAFSAKGGYDVPEMAGPGIDGKGGQMGVVHPREMILPAEYADMIRNGGMGGMQVHISAVDARSVRRLFMDHNSDLAKALRKHVRDGGRA